MKDANMADAISQTGQAVGLEREPDRSIRAQVFRYTTPRVDGTKAAVPLAHTEIQHAAVKIVNDGGETNLHAHPHLDAVWFVLRGRARFTTVDGELVAELSAHQGVLIPAMFPYMLEKVGDEPLEILDVSALTERGASLRGRVNYTPDLDPTHAGRPEQ